jgi:hypothetical protein
MGTYPRSPCIQAVHYGVTDTERSEQSEVQLLAPYPRSSLGFIARRDSSPYNFPNATPL